MAHVISVTDGTTTITFTAANGYQVEEYDMLSPEFQAGSPAPDVAETMVLYITGSTTAQVQARRAALDLLLDKANLRTRWGIGPAIFLQVQWDGDAGTYRAELYEYRPEDQEDTLRLWPNRAPTINLSIRRAAHFERTTPVQIPATNGNGTNNTAGLTVSLHEDGSADGFIQFAAGDVQGNLPTPLILELTNNTGAAVQYDQILMAGNAFSNPTAFSYLMQAEQALAAGGSVLSDASCSNGQYVQRAFTGTDNQQYNLSQTLLQTARGHDFHLLARFRARTADVYVRPNIYDATGVFPLWTGDEVHLPLQSPAMADLGVIPLPPGGYSTSFGAMRLRLDWRTPTSVAVETDFFAFFPAATFRKLKVLASVANGSKIVDDPTAGRAYIATSGGIETPAVAPQGLPLLVWPNTAQAVYFTWSLANLSAPITQTLSVRAWHRPRRYSF
ncbi:MAG: hypothetical protein KBH81_10310 [Phycisphaerae bacterium]|jgi:hypothetical protein|nr:hypothetical protein [Phycisphaerae bacterium]